MYRSDIEQDSEPTKMLESIRERAGVNVGKEKSIREEMSSFRDVIENTDEIATEALDNAKRAREETVTQFELSQLRNRTQELEKLAENISHLVLQQIGEDERFRCPSCDLTVSRSEYRRSNNIDSNWDGAEMLRCPNCKDETKTRITEPKL